MFIKSTHGHVYIIAITWLLVPHVKILDMRYQQQVKGATSLRYSINVSTTWLLMPCFFTKTIWYYISTKRSWFPCSLNMKSDWNKLYLSNLYHSNWGYDFIFMNAAMNGGVYHIQLGRWQNLSAGQGNLNPGSETDSIHFITDIDTHGYN